MRNIMRIECLFLQIEIINSLYLPANTLDGVIAFLRRVRQNNLVQCNFKLLFTIVVNVISIIVRILTNIIIIISIFIDTITISALTITFILIIISVSYIFVQMLDATKHIVMILRGQKDESHGHAN